MTQDGSRDDYLRDAAASARNAKAIVTPAVRGNSPTERYWDRIARKLFEQGHEERDVMEALRRQGAKSYMAADAVAATRRYYRNVHHMANRKEGLVAVASGAMLWLLAGGVVLAAMHGWGVGRLIITAGGLFISGIVPVVFGLYKVLTGSSVPIVLPEDRD